MLSESAAVSSRFVGNIDKTQMEFGTCAFSMLGESLAPTDSMAIKPPWPVSDHE